MITNIVLKPEQVGTPLGDLYGLFFEDLNHAADGGLYAELVQNGSFEFSPLDNKEYQHLTAWEDLSGAELDEQALHLRVLSNKPVHPQNNHYLKINTLNGCAIRNLGYNQGMFFKEGENYLFSIFAKSDFFGQRVTVQLQTKNGVVAAEAIIEVTAPSWQKYQVLLTADNTATEGRLVLIFPAETDLAIDNVSLFPEKTFKNRENGCRADLCQLLADMKPKFLRFPGGCLVHDGSLNAEDRDSMYRWKNTIGPVETRATKRNGWGYNQSYGLGYYEYFVLCEDLGAKPLPVLPGGWDPHHQRAIPLDEMGDWIDDALDLIDFANGSVDTKWGGLRQEMGHPEPFNLEYLAIGNEEVGQEFFDRYVFFHEAIRRKHPEIKLVNSAGPFSAGSEWQRGWDSARANGSDLVDEHYYCSPEWFIANHHHYDQYDRQGPKVLLGEYAAKSNRWWSALAEATYMIGLERNADKVGLACYAPMLCNVDYCNWAPDLIWYDQSQAMGSVNYDVQKLFMEKQGTHNLAFEAQNLPPAQIIDDQPIIGMLSLKGDHAEIELKSIKLVDEETGQVTKVSDTKLSGDQRLDLTSVTSERYTLSFCFKKIGGQWDKGFKIFFGMKDEQNRYGWSLGGWQNQDCLIEIVKNGSDSVLTQSIWQVVTDTTYECQLEVKGRQIKTTINGEVFNETEDLPYLQEAAYINAVVDEELGTTILKLVNIQAEPFAFTLKELTGRSARTISLQANPDAENKLGTPSQVQTETADIMISEEPLQVPGHGVLFVEIK